MSLTAVLLLFLAAESRGGRPRVYNALISTNQELLPSRAYPAVSPVIGQPVYLTSGLQIHHKQNQEVEVEQPYQDVGAYEYQGEEVEQVGFDNYDDQQFQAFGAEERQEVGGLVAEGARRSSGRLSQDIARPAQDRTPELARHSARPVAHQEAGRRQYQRPRHQVPSAEEGPWEEAAEPSPGRRAVERTHPEPRGRTQSKLPEPRLPSQNHPGPSPPPNQFYTSGIPLNNQPANIPVVPPPPIPIKYKN